MNEPNVLLKIAPSKGFSLVPIFEEEARRMTVKSSNLTCLRSNVIRAVACSGQVASAHYPTNCPMLSAKGLVGYRDHISGSGKMLRNSVSLLVCDPRPRGMRLRLRRHPLFIIPVCLETAV